MTGQLGTLNVGFAQCTGATNQVASRFCYLYYYQSTGK